ncbi:hypothetical protein DL771_005921 [Monosporascus sp. 5C6A]|nr:hypothetical protein DL771_005921 [Monosporascus sp. 5C6A]
MYELMRVFPIVQTLARVAVGEQGVPIDNGSAIVPTGTRLVVDNTTVHYDPAIWPSPDVIEPRRWLVKEPHLSDPTEPLRLLATSEQLAYEVEALL